MQAFLMKILILCLSVLLILPALAQDAETDFPDIIGKTVPEAEALLNESIYRLDPIILATDTGTDINALNTVASFEIADDGIMVQVTVLREYNVELIWEHSEAFAGQAGLRNLDGNELFTFVNLSGEAIALRNIEIANFDSSDWLVSLPTGQCAQIWSFSESNPLQLPQCAPIQGGNVANRTDFSGQFWLNGDRFDIFQNGLYRGTCENAGGRCKLWLSPLALAEDIAAYVYMIYDNSELLIYNNSDTQWMDIEHLRINDSPALSANSNWNTVTYPDMERLAPGQCVRFSKNSNKETIEDCFVIATQDTAEADIFWIDSFTVNDRLRANSYETCPPAIDERTICLFGR